MAPGERTATLADLILDVPDFPKPGKLPRELRVPAP